MVTLFFISILIAICSAICGFVYIRVLQQPEHILGWWHKLLTKIFNNDKRFAQGKQEYWLYTILGGCEVCNTGQIALWSYGWFAFRSGTYQLPLTLDMVSAVMFHVFTICCAILFVIVIKHLHDNSQD